MRRNVRRALCEGLWSLEWQSISYSRRAKLESVPSSASCCQSCSGAIYFSCWLQNAWLTPRTCCICSRAWSLYPFTFWQEFAFHVGALGSRYLQQMFQAWDKVSPIRTISAYLQLPSPSLPPGWFLVVLWDSGQAWPPSRSLPWCSLPRWNILPLMSLGPGSSPSKVLLTLCCKDIPPSFLPASGNYWRWFSL